VRIIEEEAIWRMCSPLIMMLPPLRRNGCAFTRGTRAPFQSERLRLLARSAQAHTGCVSSRAPQAGASRVAGEADLDVVWRWRQAFVAEARF
jgi:hypothetical protein